LCDSEGLDSAQHPQAIATRLWSAETQAGNASKTGVRELTFLSHVQRGGFSIVMQGK
jgi:hypothetical protein